jgi:UDPglucose 6-dehydrogenase
VSNPEFLREGQAVEDFLRPERVVVGTSSEKARDIMERLYRPFIKRNSSKFIVTDEPSAEMIKYAANAFLATKISFINQIAGLCERVGADVSLVRQGIGSDSRIGDQFLYAGPGYGGSCFPKDVLALSRTANEVDYAFGILDSVMKANASQKLVVPKKIEEYYDSRLEGKVLAFWGLAFKDNTDDVRESPSLAMIQSLLSKGVKVQAYDPQAIETTKQVLGDIPEVTYFTDEYDALEGADALVIATNWREFSAPDFERMKKLLKKSVIFDARNMYDLKLMENYGFYYSSIGRRVVQ